MKLLSRISVLLIVLLLGATSCGDEPDGKRDKIKWTNVDNLMNVNGVYYLPEEGGTCSFTCRNYSNLWMTSIVVDGVRYEFDNGNRLEFFGDWLTLKIEGNNLMITANALPESIESRGFTLEVTSGDVFDTIVFGQKKNVY